MAYKIKSVSKFSEDAIDVALKNLSREDREAFERGMDVLTRHLGTKVKKVGDKKISKISDQTVFEEHILPQIHQKINEIETKELGQKFQIKPKFSIKTNFEGLSFEQLKKEHTRITTMEDTLQNCILLIQLSRGELYHSMHKKHKKEGTSFKQFVMNELKVSYMTTLRYMTLSSILSEYPRLALCDLTFSQLIKHKNRLIKHLNSKTGLGLRDKLGLSIEIVANDHQYHLENKNIDSPPKLKLSVDPDWAYHDKAQDFQASEASEQDFQAGSQASGFGDDNEVEELENFVENMQLKEDQ